MVESSFPCVFDSKKIEYVSYDVSEITRSDGDLLQTADGRIVTARSLTEGVVVRDWRRVPNSDQITKSHIFTAPYGTFGLAFFMDHLGQYFDVRKWATAITRSGLSDRLRGLELSAYHATRLPKQHETTPASCADGIIKCVSQWDYDK